MSLRSQKPAGEPAISDLEQFPTPKPYKRRWRLAFTAIYFTRALTSPAKKLQTGNNSQLLHSLSYVAIDLQPNNQDDRDNACDKKHLPSVNIDEKSLADMVKEKNLELLSQFGGVRELAAVLETDMKSGVSGAEPDLKHRKNVFGTNEDQKPPVKGLLSFVLEAFKDPTIIILLVCAIRSLGFGIKQHGLKDGWYDGGIIIVAVFLVVIVSALSNFKQSRQFEKLSSKSNDKRVEVVRDGLRRPTSIFDVVVGDLVCLKVGDQVPADGLFLEGHSLKVDESSMTGESDHIKINDGSNPFLLSGTKVTDGFGLMIVTSVGMNTLWGKMMSSISRDLDEQTPLQVRLNNLTSYIGKLGSAVALLVLMVSPIPYFTGNTADVSGNRESRGRKMKFDDVMSGVGGIVDATITIVVVAIPEGLPRAVTLTLAYSMKKMMNNNALVRKRSACETMGSATTICTNKTGSLTLNKMKVTEFWLGTQVMTEENITEIVPNVCHLLQEAVGLNTTGSICKPNSSSPEISGSPTEKAILSWALFDLGMNIDEVKQGCEIIHVETFNSQTKRSGVLIRRNNEKGTQTHWKGAAEMILAMCANYYDKTGALRAMDDEERKCVGSTIQNMASKSLRCIAFAHRMLEDETDQFPEKLEEGGMTLLGLVGIEDPCRPEVRTAVDGCRAAGVNVTMITGDNLHTEERMERIDKIRVMARSSPFDKLLMVQCLKQRGHVVAITGDGMNDAPALKEADIGLSMGIQGTEVAKESSDIVILDDNFASVVTVLRWGRCVYNNIQKFLQFQLTINVVVLVVNFVAAVSSGKVPLTAVQLLWVNLIMDNLGALALATEEPTNDLMEMKPVGRTEPLITRIMWRNLVAQALYQITILLTLQFKGRSIFRMDEKVKNTLIFNIFVFCQVFNEFNARKLEKKNIFKGLLKSKLFLAIIGITIVLQLLMVEFLKKFASTERLDWGQWGACVGIAALSWPIGWLVKCIPVSGCQVPRLRAPRLL